MPCFGGSLFPLFHKMGRRGFLLAAPGFMIAGVVSGIHLERNRTKVTIAPVNKTVQNAQKFGMDQEHLPPHKKDTIDAITAYRRAQNEIDDLLEQMLKHPSAPIEELKARNDQQHANIVGLSLTSMGIRAGFAGTLMVQAAQLLSIEQKLLGKNHPDFARKHNEMSDLLHGGLFPLLKAETADAALEERIAADEFVDNPVENFQKWTDNLDGLQSHYSFGFKSVPDNLFKGRLDQRDDAGRIWVTFAEQKMSWEKTPKENST
ncbi:hypothetical protein IWX90DRAFT_265585 [Phyllosticta citrichinensis]|uniref:Uncharacterized protein n=1 Tax=Phyllosticta citrichinensis TaxID=1130410 RepID=A0ABR1XMN0_9PEZI